MWRRWCILLLAALLAGGGCAQSRPVRLSDPIEISPPQENASFEDPNRYPLALVDPTHAPEPQASTPLPAPAQPPVPLQPPTPAQQPVVAKRPAPAPSHELPPPTTAAPVEFHHSTTAQISLNDAISLALQNSNIARVQDSGRADASEATAFDIAVARQQEQAALAAFDASLNASIFGANFKRPPNTFFGPGLAQPTLRDELNYTIGVAKPSQFGGTLGVDYNPDPAYLFIPGSTGGFNPTHVGQLEFSISQPLLQGRGRAVNRAPICISQISAQQSAWEFKAAVMDSVRDTASAYWDLQATRAQLAATNDVIAAFEKVAQLQVQAFQSEWVIKADVAKAYAQLHRFRQRRLELESDVVEKELRLRSLAGLPPGNGDNLLPVTEPARQFEIEPADVLLADAMQNDPELVQQRLQLKIRQVELLVAKNQLLPKVDLQALYRLNGVGRSLPDAVSQLSTAEFADWEVGATLSVPIGRRQARANTAAAELQLARERELLQQKTLSVSHRIASDLQRIEFTRRQLAESVRRVQAAEDWVRGARLRFENPTPQSGGTNWLLASLNDYIDALQFQTQSIGEQAELLAQYNTALTELRRSQGVILDTFAIYFEHDPCRQACRLVQ